MLILLHTKFTGQSSLENLPDEPPGGFDLHLVGSPSLPGESNLSLSKVSVETPKDCIYVVSKWNTENCMVSNIVVYM